MANRSTLFSQARVISTILMSAFFLGGIFPAARVAYAVGDEFQIAELGVPLYGVDVEDDIGDSRGGIAVCGSNVLINKDGRIGIYESDDFGGFVDGPDEYHSDTLLTNMETGVAYAFDWDGDFPATFDKLYAVDCETGEITEDGIDLQTDLVVNDNYNKPGLFSGYGRVVVYSGDADGNLYNIDLATGAVTEIAELCPEAGTDCFNPYVNERDSNEQYFEVGVAEYFDEQVHLVYAYEGDNSAEEPSALKRYSVDSEAVTVIFEAPEGSDCSPGDSSNFGIGDDFTFVADPANNKIYSSTEYGYQFPWVTDVLDACGYDEPVVAYSAVFCYEECSIGDDPSITAYGATRLIGSTSTFASDRVRWAWLSCRTSGDGGTDTRLPAGCRTVARGSGLGSALERRAYRVTAQDRRHRYVRVAIYADGSWHYSSTHNVR
jgi:hypothetical protein